MIARKPQGSQEGRSKAFLARIWHLCPLVHKNALDGLFACFRGVLVTRELKTPTMQKLWRIMIFYDIL